MTTLQNKTALVTGASRGIGRATAAALATAGARVLLHYGRSAAEADSAVAEIRAAGGQADPLQADLAAVDGAAKLAAEVRTIVSTLTEGDEAAVDSGLQAGETVVIDGVDKLQQGTKVSVRMAGPKVTRG